MKFTKTLAAAAVSIAALGTAASAHTVGIGDSVTGASASIFLAHWHGGSSAPRAGILMTGGPLDTMQYAFDTNLGSVAPLATTEWDTGLTGGASGYFALTLNNLVNGTYTYRLDTSVNNGTSVVTAPSTGPSNGSYYTGSFVVVDGISPVPLPAGLPLALVGLGAFGLMGWRKKRKA